MTFMYFMIKYHNEQRIFFLSSKNIEIQFLNLFVLIEDTDA